eukprot:TRINITY_DN5670_c0_g1_i1.p1 TRINITY_DN5670_c0_g1~~TRINITY_DN5670_c0_g1_i1.p1  ORF type:complete len:354 (-),score=32.21 TRINITY_DN5670_c0_g1_i1:6-1067(-)
MAKRELEFFLACSKCNSIGRGRTRYRCSICQASGVIVDSFPQTWEDLNKLTGECLVCEEEVKIEPFWKCCNSKDQIPCSGISTPPQCILDNESKNLTCSSCDSNEADYLFRFSKCTHYLCQECWLWNIEEAVSNNKMKQFLPCIKSCTGSYIDELGAYRLLEESLKKKIKKKLLLDGARKEGYVLCPLPGCALSECLLIPAKDRRRQKCPNCEQIFCKNCEKHDDMCECDGKEVQRSAIGEAKRFNVESPSPSPSKHNSKHMLEDYLSVSIKFGNSKHFTVQVKPSGYVSDLKAAISKHLVETSTSCPVLGQMTLLYYGTRLSDDEPLEKLSLKSATVSVSYTHLTLPTKRIV